MLNEPCTAHSRGRDPDDERNGNQCCFRHARCAPALVAPECQRGRGSCSPGVTSPSPPVWGDCFSWPPSVDMFAFSNLHQRIKGTRRYTLVTIGGNFLMLRNVPLLSNVALCWVILPSSKSMEAGVTDLQWGRGHVFPKRLHPALCGVC